MTIQNFSKPNLWVMPPIWFHNEWRYVIWRSSTAGTIVSTVVISTRLHKSYKRFCFWTVMNLIEMKKNIRCVSAWLIARVNMGGGQLNKPIRAEQCSRIIFNNVRHQDYTVYLHCHEDMSILKKLKLYDNSLKFGSMCIKKQALPETHSDRKWWIKFWLFVLLDNSSNTTTCFLSAINFG